MIISFLLFSLHRSGFTSPSFNLSLLLPFICYCRFWPHSAEGTKRKECGRICNLERFSVCPFRKKSGNTSIFCAFCLYWFYFWDWGEGFSLKGCLGSNRITLILSSPFIHFKDIWLWTKWYEQKLWRKGIFRTTGLWAQMAMEHARDNREKLDVNNILFIGFLFRILILKLYDL